MSMANYYRSAHVCAVRAMRVRVCVWADGASHRTKKKSECVRVRNVNLSKLTQILDFQKASGCSLADDACHSAFICPALSRSLSLDDDGAMIWFGADCDCDRVFGYKVRFFALFMYNLFASHNGHAWCAVCCVWIRCAQSKASDKHSTLGEIAKNVYAHFGRRAPWHPKWFFHNLLHSFIQFIGRRAGKRDDGDGGRRQSKPESTLSSKMETKKAKLGNCRGRDNL